MRYIISAIVCALIPCAPTYSQTCCDELNCTSKFLSDGEADDWGANAWSDSSNGSGQLGGQGAVSSRSGSLGSINSFGLASGGDYVAVRGPNYIDSAIIANRFRVRADAGFDNFYPDRAEFFYAQCGCFGAGAPGPGTSNPNVLATNVDYQEVTGYLERAFSDQFSVFAELPFRMVQYELDPAVNNATVINDAGGVSDLNVGFKYLLASNCQRDITFQLRIYTPTGDARRGLGTAHVSLEPSVLFFNVHSHRWYTFGEFRVWIPISDSNFNGDNFAGPVLRYGLGTSYMLAEQCFHNKMSRLDGVAEFVGWTVLDGYKFNPLTPTELDASGDTIINVKAGLRWSVGRHAIAGSYGTALTRETWYQSIARLEYTMTF